MESDTALSWVAYIHMLILLLKATLTHCIFHTLFFIPLSNYTAPMEGTGRRKSGVILGPWGGNGGSSWEDGSFTGVRAITLFYGDCVDSIQVVYDKQGRPFTADKHGGPGGGKTAEIKLQHPEEFLVGVSGHYYPMMYGTPVIRSLTFKSNMRTYGPFGLQEGTPFTFVIEGGKVVGFKGRSGSYLDSLAFTLFPDQEQSRCMLHKVQKCFNRLSSSASKSNSAPKGSQKPKGN